MDKINNNQLNGVSNVLDNLYFLEDRINEGIKALVRHIGLTKASSFRIEGAASSSDGSGGYNVTAGWICLEGEILQVDAHNAAGPLGGGESWYWTVQETNDTASEDRDIDGNTIYVTRKRRGILTRGTTPGDFMPRNADYMVDAWRESDTTAWTELAKPHASVAGNVYYRKRHGNLELRGSWSTSGQTLSQVTLPTGFRPQVSMDFYCIEPSTISSPSFNDMLGVRISYISTTGVFAFNSANGLYVIINFNDVPPIPLDAVGS